MRIFRLFALFYVAVVSVAVVPPVAAQRFVYQRGDTLYTADKTGKSPRRLLSIGIAPGTLWAAAPDGRRIAYLVRQGTGTLNGLAASAATVYLSDFDGRRRKRLFSTDALHDRQGRLVAEVAAPPAPGPLADWEPLSLSWSGDSRTLYIACERISEPKFRAAFAVDALSGFAVIDGDGRWKSIAPMTEVESRGGLLVGSGLAGFTPSGGSETIYTPLTTVNLFDQTRGALYAAPTGLAALPEYANAHAPALGPGNRIIAFANDKGLWTTDKFGKAYRRLLEGVVRRPRFEPNLTEAMGIYCLLPRPNAGDKAIYDLYRVELPEGPDSPTPPPTLILQGVDWFDLTPE